MNTKDVFLINFKDEKISLALVVWLFSFLLHNTFFVRSPAVSAIFYVIILFIIPLYIVIAIIYSFIELRKSRERVKGKKKNRTKNRKKDNRK
jgi:uncharacterized membrane protein YGL010W